jgi:hypothetical protein
VIADSQYDAIEYPSRHGWGHTCAEDTVQLRLQRSSPRSRRGKSGFHGLYLAVEVVNIRMSENEVVARSFVITYRLTRDSQPKALEFNYMKNDQGVYELRPAPPSQLP